MFFGKVDCSNGDGTFFWIVVNCMVFNVVSCYIIGLVDPISVI